MKILTVCGKRVSTFQEFATRRITENSAQSRESMSICSMLPITVVLGLSESCDFYHRRLSGRVKH